MDLLRGLPRESEVPSSETASFPIAHAVSEPRLSRHTTGLDFFFELGVVARGWAQGFGCRRSRLIHTHGPGQSPQTDLRRRTLGIINHTHRGHFVYWHVRIVCVYAYTDGARACRRGAERDTYPRANGDHQGLGPVPCHPYCIGARRQTTGCNT